MRKQRKDPGLNLTFTAIHLNYGVFNKFQKILFYSVN